MEEVVIVAGARTPVGKFQGALSSFSTPKLGAVAVWEAVLRAGLDLQQVDECIMGNVLLPDWAKTQRARRPCSAGYSMKYRR